MPRAGWAQRRARSTRSPRPAIHRRRSPLRPLRPLRRQRRDRTRRRCRHHCLLRRSPQRRRLPRHRRRLLCSQQTLRRFQCPCRQLNPRRRRLSYSRQSLLRCRRPALSRRRRHQLHRRERCRFSLPRPTRRMPRRPHGGVCNSRCRTPWAAVSRTLSGSNGTAGCSGGCARLDLPMPVRRLPSVNVYTPPAHPASSCGNAQTAAAMARGGSILAGRRRARVVGRLIGLPGAKSP
jgi:hypothetical protein